MKKFFILCLLLPISAFANDEVVTNKWQPYIGANIGVNASDVRVEGDDFFDFGAVSNFELGGRYNRYRLALNYQSRAEVSELFQILFGHTIAIKNDALRVNGYYDYISSKNFAMYIGAGLGLNRYDYTITERYNNTSREKHGITFTTGLNTGMSFSFWHLSIDLGFAVDYIVSPRIISYSPNIGLRYNF